jgi:hypothetical protein
LIRFPKPRCPLLAQLISLESPHWVCNVSTLRVWVIEYCIIFADENSELKFIKEIGASFWLLLEKPLMSGIAWRWFHKV